MRPRRIVVYCLIGAFLTVFGFSINYAVEGSSVTQNATPKPTVTPTPAVKPDPAAIARNYPKVDGSTSTHPLQVVLACKLLGVAWAWYPGLGGGERRIAPDLKILATPEVADKIYGIEHTSTHDAYVNLIAGKADFILVARAPSEDEFKAAAENKVTLDVRAVALDAFVFLVHKDNPISDLSLDKIRDIYTGKFTDWGALGGTKGPIKAYLRERNSGSQELMETLVMKGAPLINAPDMLAPGMAGPFNKIRADPAGIGYSVYYYAEFMLPGPEVKLLGINGIKPTSDAIAKYEYPLTTEVYAVVRQAMPKGSTAVMLRDWLFTPEGQAAIGESGYVPLLLPAMAATQTATKETPK